MKRKKEVLGLLLMLGVSLSSCNRVADLEYPQVEEGQGLLSLTLGTTADFATRAVTEADYVSTDNYTVVVTDKDGVEKMNCSGSEVADNMPLFLSVGSYTVKAFYGKEHPASRDEFYVFGETCGTIKADQQEPVEVMCTPTCGRITVNFDKSMADYYSSYDVKFSGTKALEGKTIDWKKNDTEPWYVLLDEGGETISFTITTTPKDEFVNNLQQGNTKKGTFELKRNKAYKMNISANYTPTIFGDLDITITIDDSTNDIPVDIEVPIEWTE